MRRVIFNAVIFFVLLTACSAVTVAIFGRGIETALTERAVRSLREIEDFPVGQCEVRFSGRTAFLSGEVHEKSWIDAAAEKIGGIHGVRAVKNGLEFHHMDRPWLQIAVNGKERTLSVSGLVPKGHWRIEALKMVRSVGDKAKEREDAEDWKVTDTIKEHVDVLEPAWIAEIGGVLPMVMAHRRGKSVQVKDEMVVLEGEVFSDADHAAMTAAARGVFARTGLSTENRFKVVPPPVPPKFELSWSEDGKVQLAGMVVEEEVKVRMEDTVSAIIEPDRKAEGAIKVGENIDDATWEEPLMLVLEGYVSAAKEGSLAIKDRKVSASAVVTSHGMRESLLELLEQQFPKDHYELDVALKVVEPPRPSIVSIIKMPGSTVRLKGILPNAGMKKRFMDAARTKLPPEIDVADEIEVKANAMDPEWLDSILEMLPLYVANTEQGGLTVYGNSLAIDAKVGTEKNWDTVWALTEQYFPDTKYQRLLDLKIAAADEPESEGGPLDPDAPLN